MKPIQITLLLLTALLAVYAFYSVRLDVVQQERSRAEAARAALIAEQEAAIPVASTALKDPEIRPRTRAFNFLVPSEPVHVEGNSMATVANQKAQGYEGQASRFFNYAYKELHEEAEDKGQMSLKQTIVGAQLDGARRLVLSAKAEATTAEWAVMAPRILRWTFAAFDKIQNDWQSKYAWIEGMLGSFREDFSDATQ